ncbi:hypothetical protein [Nocardiopsis sp. MG754419]|uniref:hypothetical protein n=1 Tax=Nocardiopsis sp. MG754419 TaxID=2259865 RepID=UPI001BAD2F32|nr:hypothetical protein [Nocardiopsis sp. MG754419]MBR8740988.1 hypothetical protein [Nocardiopsis sp. MG754419]
MIAVLLPPTLGAPFSLPGAESALTHRGHVSVRPEVAGDQTPPHGARYVALASLEVNRLVAGDASTVLVAQGDAGPLLGSVGAAQRAAHRPVLGYVLVDAPLPRPGSPTRAEIARTQGLSELPPRPEEPAGYRTEHLPTVPDWPDAPCGYLVTDPAFAHPAHLAGMRGWQVRDVTAAPDTAAAALADLVTELVR